MGPELHEFFNMAKRKHCGILRATRCSRKQLSGKIGRHLKPPCNRWRVSTRNLARNQRQRNHEELVANYAQRYCVKNDTIGFFGPVAWGRIEPGSGIIELSHGPSLTKRRQTYFENWAIDKVAASLSALEGMDWWIPPRLVPDAVIEKGTLHRPGSSPVAVSELEQAILSRCDGKTLPEEILQAIQNDPQFGGCSQSELKELLKGKADEGVLVWRFLVPVEVNSEIALRQQLLRVGDIELRTTALNALDKLEAARREVEGAAGDPIQLKPRNAQR